MFGYFNPRNSASFRKIKNRFKAYYCSTCKSLEYNYGQAARFLLSFDVSLLAMLLNFDVENIKIHKGGILRNCGKFENARSSHEWKAIAALGILIFAGKLEDDIRDDKSTIAKIARNIYKKTISKAKEDFPAMANKISTGYAKIVSDEERGMSAGVIAHDFAEMMSCAIASTISLSKQQENIIYIVSGWIYLIDALDDYDKDIRRKHYNPFCLENHDFGAFIDSRWREINATLKNIMDKYTFFDEDDFDYYSTDVLLNEFIPEVTHKILSQRGLKMSFIEAQRTRRTKAVFVNNNIPFSGFTLKVEVPNYDTKIAEKIISILVASSSFWEGKLRICFMSNLSYLKSVNIIYDIIKILNVELPLEIMSSTDYALQMIDDCQKPYELPSSEVFEDWLTDKNAVSSESFLDLVCNFLYGNCNNCCFNSCLGRNFLIDSSGSVFACEKKLIPIENIYEYTTNTELIDVLQSSVRQREICSASCDVFDFCGGGCPKKLIESTKENGCPQGSISELLQACKQVFTNLLRYEDMSKFNKYVRGCILEYIAYNRGEGGILSVECHS